MSAARGEFSSRLGFVLAAAGSAVGLGNIWGFPTQAASNGGAAFLVIYLALAFLLAYPALMAELIIGRHAKANAVKALRTISTGSLSKNMGVTVGYVGIATVSMILSFYAIVAGWMLAYFLSPVFLTIGMEGIAHWLESFSTGRNLLFMVLFMLLTISIICGGVKNGIEKWSERLMPSLLIILLLLIVYVLTLDGAMDGVKAYLIPDFSRAMKPELIISALGQAFFSMSLGVGTMLIYGSYISNKEMLIIPAMYVAQTNGVQIYDAAGDLIAEDTLIFTVLPALFDTMGGAGVFVSFAFFILMSIAALTSSISMLEVPVAYAVENHAMPRMRATLIISCLIMLISMLIIMNFETLFSFVIQLTTQYSQPLSGLMLCIFAGWIWHRDGLLSELKKGNQEVENSLFWKVWPSYVRYVCPLAILALFLI